MQFTQLKNWVNLTQKLVFLRVQQSHTCDYGQYCSDTQGEDIMRDYKILPQVLITIAANGGSFLHGIGLGWSAPSGPKILSPDHSFVMSLREFSWAVSLMPLGCALSCVLSGIVRNRFGTRLTMFIFAMPNLLGWFSIIFATNPLMIIVGRLFVGLGSAAYAYNIPVFVGEIASKEIRGILLTLYQVTVRLGLVFVFSLGYLTDFFTLNAICGSLIIVYTFYFMFLPETPIFLVNKNKPLAAEKSIKLLRGAEYDAKTEVLTLQNFRDKALKAPKSSFSTELKKPATFRAFIIVIILFFFFQMCGNNAIVFYTTTIFIEAGITMDPALATIIIGVVQVFSTLLTAAFVDRYGRTFLLKISYAVMIVGLTGIGTFFRIKESGSASLETFDWLPLPSLCLFSIGFSLGMGSIPFVLVGEFFSSDAKKVIAPFSQTMSFSMSFAVGNLYPNLVNLIGIGSTFFMFAGFCILGLLFTIFVIPETKGKSLEEIQNLLGKKKRTNTDQ